MKLNRTLGVLMVAAATVGAGVAAAAATTTTATTSESTPAPAGKHWHHRGGMLVGMTLRAMHQLNLTSEQQSQIKSILAAARSQHQAATAGTVDMAVLGNPGDPNYAAALQSAKARVETRLQKEVELQSQIYNVLTADQKAKLPQVLADMKTKAEARRAAWLQQHSSTTTTSPAGSN